MRRGRPGCRCAFQPGSRWMPSAGVSDPKRQACAEPNLMQAPGAVARIAMEEVRQARDGFLDPIPPGPRRRWAT